MDPEVIIVPSREPDFVFLSRTKQGRLFRKHILTKGELIHPTTGAKLTIDDAFVATMKANFDAGVCDHVQVPLADKDNSHDERPDRNVGEVIDLQEEGGKIYAVIDARKHADDFGKTLLGASAFIHLNYKDTKTGERVGPTLLHTAVTNRPYITGLEDFREIVAASADSVGEAEAVLFTEVPTAPASVPDTGQPEPVSDPTRTAQNMLTKDELLAALKDQHGVDVVALQAQADAGKTASDVATELTASLSAKLTEAGVIKLAGGNEDTITTEDVIGAVTELASTNLALTGRLDTLEKRDAESVVDGFVREGRILPVQRDTYVELRLSNPSMFERMVPAEAIVKMDTEAGVTPPEDEKHKKNIDEEIARLTAPSGSNAHMFKVQS
jgi:hypothetical protein